MAKKKRVPEKYRRWIEARKRFRLSHAQVQMARELGLNPGKFARLASSAKQQRWKNPLPRFIERLYEKQFRRQRPETVGRSRSFSLETVSGARRNASDGSFGQGGGATRA